MEAIWGTNTKKWNFDTIKKTEERLKNKKFFFPLEKKVSELG
jgi:hypothetical protein